MLNTKEIWKPITEFNGEYEISNNGKIRSLNKDGIVMHYSVNPSGKPQVNFKFNKESITRTIESLVAKEFFGFNVKKGNVPNKYKIMYRDGNRENVSTVNMIIPS